MPSVFPGMDPFLEGPLWPSFHAQFCSEIARRLTPALGERYVALVEERLIAQSVDDVAIAARLIRPDVTVAGRHTETGARTSVLEPPMRLEADFEIETPVHFVEIRDVANMTVVTVIEALSPANKTGEGRTDYLRKRRSLLHSDVNLIELDLLRGGERVPMRDPLPDAPYFALLYRAAMRPMADTWPIGLRAQLPTIPIPLLSPDPDAALDLQAVFQGAFDSVGYGRVIDYSRALQPPLTADDASWAAELVSVKLAR
jgi:hypothetical protein